MLSRRVTPPIMLVRLNCEMRDFMDGRARVTRTKRDTSSPGEHRTSMHTGPKQSMDFFSLYVLIFPITGHVMIP